MKFTPLQYIQISLILIAILILNMLFINSPILGLFFGLFYLSLNSLTLSKIITFDKYKISLAFLLIISFISLLGAVIYFFYQLNNLSISLILISIPLIIYHTIKNKKSIQLKINAKIQKPDLLTIIYTILIALSFYILLKSQTIESIRSPWNNISPAFLTLYFISTIIILIKRKFLLLVITHFLLSFSIALIIYPIGYGFDPFIHQATEKVIYLKGLITPKPLYYLGQYSIVVILAKIFQISIQWIDKLLVPLLCAVYIPLVIYLSSFYRGNFKKILPIFFLTIPFSEFIFTTPQSLANFFIIIIIFLSFKAKENKTILALLTLTTLAIHPLAGLPVLFFVLLLFIYKYKFKNILLPIVFIISSISIPLALFINSLTSTVSHISFKLVPFYRVPNSIINFPYQFNSTLDLLYLYAFNWKVIFIIIAAIGVYIIYKKKILNANYKLLAIFPLSLLINYIFLKYFITFEGVIYYEQSNYADRLIILIFYFLSPFFLYTISIFLEKLSREKILLKTFFLILASIIITSSLYFSYPRYDDYTANHGYNMSANDIKAVKWIEASAKNNNYIVLANQMISAAALKEFGFKRYFNTPEGEIFYYPIPTGEKMYQYFLEMSYHKPSENTIQKAMNTVGADEGFFVVNKYWWGSDRVIEYAKAEAKEWNVIGEDDIYIFKY